MTLSIEDATRVAQVFKGLGEMNDHELWETTMDPEHRILKQVTLDEAADADETFTILMGDDVDVRHDDDLAVA